MIGALNFANNTWNKVGDDVQIGDINEGGTLGIQGINNHTGLRFTTYNQTSKTTGGKILWNGTQFSLSHQTEISGILKVTANNNTVSIGSQNTGFTHIYNSTNIPFIFNNSVLTASSTGTLGRTDYPFHQLILGGATTSVMTAASTNPRITFQDGTTESQPVHLIYSVYDSYRAPAGLKIIGGSSASPAWFESEGKIYANNAIHQLLTGSGTVGKDAGSGDNRYQPSKWTFNTGLNAADGDIYTIKIPVAGHYYGVYMSVNNGTNYYPVVLNGTGRLTTHYPSGSYIRVVFESGGSATSIWPLNGGTATTTVTGGAFRVLNYYDADSNTVPSAQCETAAGTAAKTATMTNFSLKANSYLHVNIRYANTAQSAITFNVNSTGAKPIYINGAASSASNYTLPAGSYIVFYNGTNYYFRTDAVLPGTETAIKSITRSGTTFTYTKMDGTTGTFTQQDNNTWTKVSTTTDGYISKLSNNAAQFLNGQGAWTVPPGTYSLPTASASTLGGIKVGTGLAISSGVLSVSISNNVTGSGTANYLAKFSGANTIANGPLIGTATTTYLRNDGTWATPPNTNTWRPVQNVLSSTATDQSLSANMGKTLNDTKVAKAGDTMSGNLKVQGAGEKYVSVQNTTTSAILYLDSASNYHGLYSNGYWTGSAFTSSGKWIIYRGNDGEAHSGIKIYGAVWNDYAEYRQTKGKIEPGRCISETGNGDLILTTKRLQRGCEIVTDTYGFAIGQSERNNTPVATSGRVLAYLYEDKDYAKNYIGYPVCSGPNGTVSIMTEEEEMHYPSCILGTISEIPNYEEWECGDKDNLEYKKVNGRIWIRVK